MTNDRRSGASPGLLGAHLTIGWALVIANLGLIAFYVPRAAADPTLRENYVIFFVHFPSAVTSLLFFLLAGGISVWYLARRTVVSDLWAASAVEVGVLGCTATLVTGSIWAKAAWGHWWEPSDPRLMTVAIMWLSYVAYLVLRDAIEEPSKRATFSAVFATIAAVNIPLVHMAVRIFGPERHPPTMQGTAEMVATRWFGAFAFLVLYTALWRLRYRTARVRRRARRLEEEFARAGI